MESLMKSLSALLHDHEEGATPTLQSGHPWPMGATWDGHGVNFAVFSAHAAAIELCIFDAQGKKELHRLPLPARTQDVWHGYLPGAAPGLIYGLRAQGTWRVEDGQRFNPHKLLLDPYARDIVGQFTWSDEHFGGEYENLHVMDTRDNAATALKACVVADSFDWGDDRPPCIPLAASVIYELHVKGFSRLNTQMPEEIRGTFAGLGHEASIAYLTRLGINAVSLLPVHYHVDEERLTKMGLSNYWGYNTLGFFAVDPRLASDTGEQSSRDEFRSMVKSLHAAGIEVFLDVVYNHTAESDDAGPTLSFRGLDNISYYRLRADSHAHYENHTGTGNTLDMYRPKVRQLVLDSLRYWVEEMHVDGFRFDLAPVMGRGVRDFDRDGPFFTAIEQDPVLSRVKMIAEPWDIGAGGYQVGNFPRGWLEWNDHFRDATRNFWLRAGSTRGDLALRLCGSSDLYHSRRREPVESVNYVVSHDGFTLRDLVSYNERHNEANGEHNRDGHGHNLSFNCGAEGPSDDPAVLTLRGKFQRALLATTLLAQGTPMLAAGDELGHTQHGNNNPYCQDNETTWIDWSQADQNLINFTAALLAIRRQALPFGNHWYSGLSDPLGLHDLTWLNSDGSLLQGTAWRDPNSRVFGCLIGQPGRAKAPLLLLLNGDSIDCPFMLPAGVWEALVDTDHPRGYANFHGQGEVLYPLRSHSVVILTAAGNVIKL
jgi:glycogen debranching enzyme GlgX